MKVTLKAARINKGMTQRQAAKMLRISAEALGNYEHGKTFPAVPVIKRIENVYGVCYDDLIFLPSDTV